MKTRLLFSALLMITLSLSANAASPVITAKVLNVGTYGNGDMFVMTDVAFNDPNCPFPANPKRFDIKGTHPQAKNWLSIALAANVSGKPITFLINGCMASGGPAGSGRPTLDEYSSFLMM